MPARQLAVELDGEGVHRDRRRRRGGARPRPAPRCRSGRGGSRPRSRPGRCRSTCRARRRSGGRSRSTRRARSSFTSASSLRHESAGSSPSSAAVGAERREAVERDPAAGGVEARLGQPQRRGAVRGVAREVRVRLPSPRGSARSACARSRDRCRRSRGASSRPTTSRVGAASSETPQRPMPVSSLTCTGTPSGTRR